MDKIEDFHCIYDGPVGIPKAITEKFQLTFPDAYQEGESMALLAEEIKKIDQAAYCILPFCHTVEGEALGGNVNMGNADIGPRAKDYICNTAEELMALPAIDFTKGRIAEVLRACRILREKGEHVVLQISGPFTILNVLMDARYVFRILKKQPEMADLIMDKLRREIFGFMQKAKEAGVNFLSYADSSGGVNILGPHLARNVVDKVTYPLIADILSIMEEDMVLLLCPKTSLALIGAGKAKWDDVLLPEPMTYGAACVASLGKTKILGQMCVKNTRFLLHDGKVKCITLL